MTTRNHMFLSVDPYLENRKIVFQNCCTLTTTTGTCDNLKPSLVTTMNIEAEDPLEGSFMDVSIEEVAVEEVVEQRKTFKCDLCQKYFRYKYNLSRHIKIHDKSKTYKCSKCTQYFENQEDLERHKNDKHTNSHLCRYCGKLYKTKSNLNEHIRLHEDDNTSKVHLCPFENCRKKFSRVQRYQDHLNLHTKMEPFSCSSCPKKFINRYTRNEHQKICSGILEAKCDDCGSSFTDKKALHRHKEAQHQQRRFSCDCGSHYKYYSSLYKHMKKKGH